MGWGINVIRASYPPPPPKVDILWQTRRMCSEGRHSGIPVSPRDWLYLHNYVSVSVVCVFNRMIVWREISDR